jgi:NAD(P)-dependent dehydrogenase (short-subunit alcohol dehydrogenase family)
LGREIAFELAQEGCNLVIVDVDLEGATKVASEIVKKYGVKAKAYRLDVSDYTAIKRLKEDVEKTMGYVDILVNNAGIIPLISLREGSHEDIQKIINVNLTAHFWVYCYKEILLVPRD